MSSHCIPAYPQNFAENESDDAASIIVDNGRFEFQDLEELDDGAGGSYINWYNIDGNVSRLRGAMPPDGSAPMHNNQWLFPTKDLDGLSWDWKALFPISRGGAPAEDACFDGLRIKPDNSTFSSGGEIPAAPNQTELWYGTAKFYDGPIQYVRKACLEPYQSDGSIDSPEPAVMLTLEGAYMLEDPTLDAVNGADIRIVIKAVQVRQQQVFDQQFYSNRQMMNDRYAGGHINLIEV